MTDITNQSFQADRIAVDIHDYHSATTHAAVDPFMFGLTVFVLACFVGYYVVWRVTPALHTPLMAVTNAISGIIVVGAIIAMGAGEGVAGVLGFVAVMLASINIFGGFIVTQRMLQMFKKKEGRK
jgi:NAD(P) transhydrogenase subunit alpha